MRDFQKPGRSAVYATNGMCASSHPLASLTAISLLQAGGSAADAAIGAALVLGFCEPQMTGLGGDAFVLIKPAGREDVLALNGSGRAPAALSAEALRAAGHQSMPLYGVEAVTLPGAIAAFCRLHADHGRLALDQVLAPAIRAAEEGVPVAPRTASDWQETGRLKGAARTHFLPWGRPPQVGEIFRAPGQAEVLRRIAREGARGFYEGEVAEDMLTSLRALGGCHSAEDFASVTAFYDTPVSAPYQGAELIEHPPNGQGVVALLMLNILSHFDLAAMDPFGSLRTHLEAEATKLAYDARNRMIADPDHTTRLAHMLAPETAAKLAALIDPKRALPAVAAATEAIHKDTVCLSVTDRDGMVVSLIYSTFHAFGTGLASEKFGISFQNRGAGFSLEAGHPNEAAGGKRPMHTIIPGMLAQNGRVVMPFGVMGGAYQPAGHARLVSNLRDYGMDLQSAIDAPRSFCGPFSGTDSLRLERGYDQKTAAELADMGHTVTWSDEPLGGAQAIFCHESGVFEGGSDPRKDGCALGY